MRFFESGIPQKLRDRAPLLATPCRSAIFRLCGAERRCEKWCRGQVCRLGTLFLNQSVANHTRLNQRVAIQLGRVERQWRLFAMALGAIEVSFQYDRMRFLEMQKARTRFRHQLPQHFAPGAKRLGIGGLRGGRFLGQCRRDAGVPDRTCGPGAANFPPDFCCATASRAMMRPINRPGPSIVPSSAARPLMPPTPASSPTV